jgi:hypothetical protein
MGSALDLVFQYADYWSVDTDAAERVGKLRSKPTELARAYRDDPPSSRQAAISAGAREDLRAFHVVEPRSGGSDRRRRGDVNVVVELVERALKVRVVADLRSNFGEVAVRLTDVVAVGLNVRQLRVRSQRRDADDDSGEASDNREGESLLHCYLLRVGNQ